MSNVDVQLKAPAETGEREINSKRRAAAEEEETTLVKNAMIEQKGYLADNKNADNAAVDGSGKELGVQTGLKMVGQRRGPEGSSPTTYLLKILLLSLF